MTCPTTACFNGLLPGEETVKVGGLLRFFGDGHQASKKLDGRRYWRVPVMDGEFLCEDIFGVQGAVAGGNFLILATDQAAALRAAEAAVQAIRAVPGVILPFPGGIVRSGSKVGSRYKKLRASTNDAYCPTLRGLGRTRLPMSVHAVYEIVIDGLDVAAVEAAMRVGRPGRVRAGGRADQRGQLRRQARPVPPAPPQDSRLVTVMIIETVVTTLDEDGEANFAAMGVVWGEDRLVIRPYVATRTFRNLVRTREAVVNVTDDVLTFAKSALSGERFPARPAARVRGSSWPMRATGARSPSRTCRCPSPGRRAGGGPTSPRASWPARWAGRSPGCAAPSTPWWRRASSPRARSDCRGDEVLRELDRLDPLVDRTGGPAEREAMAYVRAHVTRLVGA